MKHKTHPKSMNVRLLTMLLACALLTVGIPFAVLADHQDEPVSIDFSSADLPAYVDTDGTVENASLKLTTEGAYINITKMIKPNTNYTFSFKMKNQVADSLIMKKGEDVNVFQFIINFFYFFCKRFNLFF